MVINISMRRLFILTSLFFFCSGIPVFAVMSHKTFVIKSYMGMDVLCGPYTVQRNDYIWDILRRKGVLSKTNFREFLAILKQLNPQIVDLDKIYPGQHIIIPLKYVKSQGADRPSFITIPVIPDILFYDYSVQAGDSVSMILAKYYDMPVSKVTSQHLLAFQRINPDIRDLNTIYPGQHIRIPELEPSQDLSEELVAKSPPASSQKSDDIISAKAPAPSKAKKPLKEKDEEVLPVKDKDSQWSRVVLSETLKSLEAELIYSGSYFFPGKDGTEHALDLKAFPLVELHNGHRVLLDPGGKLSAAMKEVLQSCWKDVRIARIDTEITTQSVLEKVVDIVGGSGVKKGESITLSDGVSVKLRGDWVFSRKHTKNGTAMYVCVTVIKHPAERTPGSIQGYLARNGIHVVDILSEKGKRIRTAPSKNSELKGPASLTIDTYDKKEFVANFLDILGVTYKKNTPINISYAGFDVELFVNLGTTPDGKKVIIDFGSFYGDIESVMTRREIKVLTVNPNESVLTIAQNILKFLDISFTEGPQFFAANRGALRTPSLAVPGILISSHEKIRTLLTPIRLHPGVCSFLKDKSIKVLKACEHAGKDVVKVRKNKERYGGLG